MWDPYKILGLKPVRHFPLRARVSIGGTDFLQGLELADIKRHYKELSRTK